ncbi:ABC transporter substrate-binding protein [Iocasia frigidifontis]|uniref:ABC transporter substrate-binding protein n=1 Tax=Iocasia fonsfrigidae TaxID=2682810 RepID=A0A8A7K604_9FIRM|nr:ABC transporter substrate-binding protein [Iocasia fonsfrigidae]QTL97203.1 ABC transporter substrate-binding protein [Iocasia fonsfrigidae]
MNRKISCIAIFLLSFLFVMTSFVLAAPIKIGCMLSLTGSGAPENGPMQQGVILAEKCINESGGILGHELQILYTDDQTKPEAAISAVNKLVKMNNIPILLGGWSSGCSIAASTLTIPNQVIQIGLGCTSPQIAYLDDNDYFFRTCPSDAGQGVALAMLAKEKGYKTASTMVVNNQYGIGIEEVFKEAWTKAGGEILDCIRVDKSKASYRSELSKVFENAPDVIINAAYPTDITVILKQWYQLDFGGDWLGAEVAKAPTLPKTLGYEIYGDFEGVSTALPENDSRKIFDTMWQEKYGNDEQSVFTAHAFDGTMIAALAIEKAGTATDRETIKDAIREVANAPGVVVTVNEFAKAKELIAQGKDIQYVGASGPINFDENGDVSGLYEHWTVGEDLKFKTAGNFKPAEISDFASEINFKLPIWWEE